MTTKRKTSPELVEIRTVLSRAKTALKGIDNVQATRADGAYARYLNENWPPHTGHEVSMMRSALMQSIEALSQVEESFGYE